MVRKRAALAVLLSLSVMLCAAGAAGASASGSEEDDNVRVLIYEDRVMFVYSDYSSYQEYMANAANSLFAVIPDTVNKYLMIAPSRITFETDDLRSISADEKAAAQYVHDHIDPSIQFVNVYDVLEQRKGRLNDVFFRLDHHWTQQGAFYAAEAFMQAGQMPYRKPDEYLVKKGEPFAGYMYLISGDLSLMNDPDPLTYYQLPGNENKPAYVYYTDWDTGEASVEEKLLIDPSRDGYAIYIDDFGFSHAIIPGDETADRALMLIGGSSTYAIAPWFADNFKTVVLIETRFYAGGEQGIMELISEYGITDILLCISFNTYVLEFA